ncbi:unnamed protein product [Schistosoma turkestanicum]|nr:unnamed protein product [Schistosoma turkestanicum]
MAFCFNAANHKPVQKAAYWDYEEMSSPRKAEVKKKKSRIADLVEEMASWEDDLTRVPLHKEPEKSVRKSSAKYNRDSLADHHNLPVYARKARWERLMNDSSSSHTGNAGDGETNKVPSSLTQESVVPKIQTGRDTRERVLPSVTSTKADIPRGSLSHAERERLERMRELAELRRSRRPVFPSSHVNPVSSVQSHVSEPEEVPCSFIANQDDDFSLPPPPSPLNTVATEDSIVTSPHGKSCDNDQSVLPEVGTCDDATVMNSSAPKNIEEADELNFSNDNTFIHNEYSPKQKNVSSMNINETQLEETVQSTVPTISTNTHPYYSRPKIGVKRRSSFSESSVDNFHEIMPRQKSVTFQKPTADTTDESETDFNYDDGDIGDCPTSSSEFSSQYEYFPDKKRTQKVDSERLNICMA